MNDLLSPLVGHRKGDCPAPPNGTLRVAMASLNRCRRSVCSLPLFAPSDRLHRGLLGLVAWYERVCEDDRFTNAAPTEALRALERMSMHPKTSTLPSVVVSQRAVRVANELVTYRKVLAARGEADTTALELALVALAEAMRGTKRHSR